jgi:hypothetical protein
MATPSTPDDKPPAADRDENEGVRKRLEQLIPDLVRRTIFGGIGAVFTTEEAIRKLAGDVTLPKDVVNFLLQQATNSKDEVLRVVGNEVRRFLESANLAAEMQKMLTQLSLEVKTEVRFIPNDAGGIKPDMKQKMAIKKKGE